METRNCQKCKQIFTLDSNDLGFYKKMKVPAPRVCPDCRFKMRAIFRNETTLYSGRKCGLCSKSIISMYNPKSLYVVYCRECYMSDSWDPYNYAIEYSKTKPFFNQLKDLVIKVPKNTTFLSSGDGPNINSDYSNMAGGLKNCYFAFNTGPAKEVFYSKGVRHSRDSSDIYFGTKVERCYEGVNISGSSGLVFSKNTFDSLDSIFVSDCRNVNNCFGCVNLRNKSYYFFNQPLSREEYKKKVDEIMGSFSKTEEIKKKFEEFSLQFAKKENNNLKTTNSIGDYLLECKNVQYGFEVANAENCKYVFSSKNIKDSIGTMGYGFQSELLLECAAVGYATNVIGSCTSSNLQDVLYSSSLRNCHDCIGCDGLQNASYCILNKQYSKEEYELIKNQIIQELTDKDLHGLMLPSELSPFAYNETTAQDNMPMTKEEALNEGFRWEDDVQKTTGKETIKAEDIADHIKDVPDSITKEILPCISCNRNYKITEQELLFYRKIILPIPRKCFYCRHQDRIKLRGPYKFWLRKCAKCNKDINTNYSPDSPEIIYCEKCYQQEVY